MAVGVLNVKTFGSRSSALLRSVTFWDQYRRLLDRLFAAITRRAISAFLLNDHRVAMLLHGGEVLGRDHDEFSAASPLRVVRVLRLRGP